jgi:hypothetical protein
MVDAVVARRADLVQQISLGPIAPAATLAGGRLLLFDPEGTLSDGAAEASTDGFYDADNVPPWDTWVLYVEDRQTEEQITAEHLRGSVLGAGATSPPRAPTGRTRWPPYEAYYGVLPLSPPRDAYLICWIPPWAIPIAQAGLYVNPERCLEWLADRETPFTNALREAGLLI